ncbi:MAG: HPF/RaiA family ribosome-associated protein [Pseudomonadota bacterium]
MDSSLKISFHNLPHSDAVEAEIRERVQKLENVYAHIVGCRVVVEAPSKNAAGAAAFAVNIEIGVPGSPIVVKSEPAADLHAALTHAFDVAKRRLKTFAERRRGT